MRTECPKLEVIVPVFNEEEMTDLLLSRLLMAFSSAKLRERRIESILFRFIDDGSTDRTVEKLSREIERGFPAVVHRLSRNFGHQAAVTAGLDLAEGDVVAVMDADLQDPPELILEMIEKWRDGYDVVYGRRKARKEFFLKVACYWFFYRILAFLSEVRIPLDSGDFSLMDRKVVLALKSLPERLRFTRGLRAWIGFRQCGITYERTARQKGRAKYTLGMLYRLATDGIASMSIRVLQITQVFAFFLAFSSLGFAAFAFRELFKQSSREPLAIWFAAGYFLNASTAFMILFSLYIVSAYLGRTYLEVKGRPVYLVAETITAETAAADTPAHRVRADA